ncbi:unnamed protein product [Arctogadus glacialis]
MSANLWFTHKHTHKHVGKRRHANTYTQVRRVIIQFRQLDSLSQRCPTPPPTPPFLLPSNYLTYVDYIYYALIYLLWYEISKYLMGKKRPMYNNN